MRKLLFVTLALTVTLLPQVLMAQDFEFVPPESTEETVYINTFVSFHGELYNNSSSAVTFQLAMMYLDVNDDWTTSLCTGMLCYPPDIRDTLFTLEANSHDSVLVDFFPPSEGTGSLWLRIRPVENIALADSVQYILHAITDGVGESPAAPLTYEVLPVYPNPFNSTAYVSVNLPNTSPVRLAVYTVTGRQVADLYQGTLEAGQHRFRFDGSGNLASGLYLIRMEAAGQVSTARAVLLK